MRRLVDLDRFVRDLRPNALHRPFAAGERDVAQQDVVAVFAVEHVGRRRRDDVDVDDIEIGDMRDVQARAQGRTAGAVDGAQDDRRRGRPVTRFHVVGNRVRRILAGLQANLVSTAGERAGRGIGRNAVPRFNQRPHRLAGTASARSVVATNRIDPYLLEGGIARIVAGLGLRNAGNWERRKHEPANQETPDERLHVRDYRLNGATPPPRAAGRASAARGTSAREHRPPPRSTTATRRACPGTDPTPRRRASAGRG